MAKITKVILLFGIFTLGSYAFADQLALVTVTADQKIAITELGVPVYWNLGNTLIIRLTQSLAPALTHRGLAIAVLDREIHPGEYFFVYKVGIGEKSAPGKILWQNDRIRLVRLSESAASSAKAAGYEMVHLPETPRSLRLESPSESPPHIFTDTMVQRLVGMVSTTNLRQTILDLQNFRTRYTYTPNCDSAARWLHQQFSNLGLTTVYDVYILNGDTSYNVEATFPGQARPDSIVIACGHFDSYSNQARTLAPGADDDASGVAAVLEIARVLTTARCRWTVKYLAFSGEEQWMKGSYHWVDSVAVRQNLKIGGVYNLDMIGYTAYDTSFMYVCPNMASRSLAFLAESMNVLYNIGLKVIHYLDEDAAGDHTPFWQAGYKGVFVIEDSEWGIWRGSNPYYHRTSDTLGNLRMSLVYRTTQLAIACLATMAGPLHGSAIAIESDSKREIHELSIAPNPMNRSTVINHPRAPDQPAQIMIYDAAGRVIRKFDLCGPKTIWDGRNSRGKEVPNGVYFARYQSKNRSLLGKIIVVR